MEKQYSVQFFTNFVDNLQNLCHTYLDFDQSVEVSGYVCVEIDNVKKERYVLSEMIQSSGRSISESYCTKVFKSTPSSTLQRNNFRDITNQTSPNSMSAAVPQQSYTSGIQRARSANTRHQSLSSSSSNTGQFMTKTRTSLEHLSQTSTSTSTSPKCMSASPSHLYASDRRGKDSERQITLAENRLTDFHPVSSARNSSCSDTLKSNFGKRRFSDTSRVKSEAHDDDDDILIVKEEPGTVDEEEEEVETSEPTHIKRREESFRLPDSLNTVAANDPSGEESFHDSLSSFTYEMPNQLPSTSPDLDSVFLQASISSSPGKLPPTSPDLDSVFLQASSFSSGQFSGAALDPNSSLDASAIIHKIRPPPIIVNTQDGKRITCQLCRNSCPTEMSFVLHMNAHPSCKACGKFVGTHMDLRSHIQNEHGQMNMHKCKFCDKVFLTRSGMMEHQRLKHEKTGPRFVCDVCGHVCVRKRHLDDHVENVHKKKNKGPS